MKRYKSKEGEDRVWFDESEIERTMELELSISGLMPRCDQPVVDLERFVERHLGVRLDPYAELEENILGLTEFVARGSPRISLNRELTEVALDGPGDAGLRGRWRATLAHEAAHVILHRCLFESAHQNLDLFAAEREQPKIGRLHRCRKNVVGFGRSANWDWREVQANKGMAALLMPRTLFGEVARSHLTSAGHAKQISPENVVSVASELARRFEVSRQAAQIRLQTLGFIALGDQTSF